MDLFFTNSNTFLDVTKLTRIIYQSASTMHAIKINEIFKDKLFVADINCEYIAINHIKIFGFNIDIVNPCKNDFIPLVNSSLLKSSSPLLLMDWIPR